MSEIVKGRISKINARSVNTRRGPSTSYSLRLVGNDGVEIDKWFSAGFKKPDASEGDYVKLTVDTNERGFHDVKELKRLKQDAAPPLPAKSAPAASGGGSFESRQANIHYQSSRKDAVEIVRLLLANDALPMSEAKTKAGTAKRYDEIVAFVNKLTVQFFFDVETLRLTKSVADAGAEKKDVGKLPDDDEAEEDVDADEGDDEEADEDDDA